jgi:hypothetical protein
MAWAPTLRKRHLETAKKRIPGRACPAGGIPIPHAPMGGHIIELC